MTIYRQSCIQFCIKKLNLAGYIQYNKKMVGQTEPHFLSDPMSDRKKKVFANSA
jgi:hypothetical protein